MTSCTEFITNWLPIKLCPNSFICSGKSKHISTPRIHGQCWVNCEMALLVLGRYSPLEIVIICFIHKLDKNFLRSTLSSRWSSPITFFTAFCATGAYLVNCSLNISSSILSLLGQFYLHLLEYPT